MTAIPTTLADMVRNGYLVQDRYSSGQPYSPSSLDLDDCPEYRYSKMLEMLGHLMEELHELRAYIPRRSWRVDEPSFLDGPRARREFLAEAADVLIFFQALMAWSGITPHELEDAYRTKSIYNQHRADHQP